MCLLASFHAFEEVTIAPETTSRQNSIFFLKKGLSVFKKIMCVFPDMCMNVGICGAPQEARGVRVPYSGEGRLCNAPVNAGNWLQSSARAASPSPAPKFHSYPPPSLLSSFFDVLPHLDSSFSHKVPRARQKYW